MRCAEALSGSLSTADASVRVGNIFSEARQIELSYDASKVSVHQLVQACMNTQPLHGKPYQAGLIVGIEEPQKSFPKMQKALKRVKGLGAVQPISDKDVVITFVPLTPKSKEKDFVTTAQLAEELTRAGVKYSGLPAAESPGAAGADDAKRKPIGSKGSTKTKPADGEPGDEKAKPTRPTGSTKTKPAKDPTDPAEKPKDDSPEDAPRFQILAVAGGKVYLADNEEKLKKFVVEGDKFGEFVVKEIGDDDGNKFVVLEKPESKETIRIEKEKKDKPKDEAGKDGGEKKEAEKKDSAKDDDAKKETDKKEPAKDDKGDAEDK